MSQTLHGNLVEIAQNETEDDFVVVSSLLYYTLQDGGEKAWRFNRGRSNERAKEKRIGCKWRSKYAYRKTKKGLQTCLIII